MRSSVARFGTVVLLVVATACTPFSSGQSRTPASPGPSPTPSAVPVSPTPVVSSSPTPAESPAPPPATAPPAGLPCPSGFVSADASGGSSAGGRVVTARVGTHPGYDRFVIEFAGSVPTYTVRRQATPAFVQSPKGDTVTLDGSAGVLVSLQPALDWTSYGGPNELRAQLPFLKEARLVENFEAVQQWALGVASPACLRAFTLGSPPRLVVDLAPAQ